MELQSLRNNLKRLQENTTCNLPVKTNGRTPHPFNTDTLFLRTVFFVPLKSPCLFSKFNRVNSVNGQPSMWTADTFFLSLNGFSEKV